MASARMLVCSFVTVMAVHGHDADLESSSMMQMPQVIVSMINDEIAAQDPESSVLLQSGFGASQSLLHMPTDEEFDEEDASLIQLPPSLEGRHDAESSGCAQTPEVAVSDGHALLQMPDFKRLDATNQESNADGTEGAVMFQAAATMEMMDASLLASGVASGAAEESVLLAPEL